MSLHIFEMQYFVVRQSFQLENEAELSMLVKELRGGLHLVNYGADLEGSGGMKEDKLE